MPVTNKSTAFPNATRSDNIKQIARNTWQHTTPEGVVVTRLHLTDIAKQYPNGKVEFNSGGYRSLVTKERMDGIGGYRIFQNKGVWYVSTGEWDNPNRVAVPFYDGIVLPDALSAPDAKDKEKEELALFKRINKFCAIIRKMETLPMPNGGDCWICAMQGEEPAEPNRNSAMGYARDVGQTGPVSDTEHFLTHLDEGYVHGTLLLNAMRWAGVTDAGISYLLQGRGPHDLVAGRVRRYLKRKLGVG